MPYSNFPKNIPTDKIDRCVEKVQRSGKSKDSAIAICYDALVKGKAAKEMAETVKEFYPMGIVDTLKQMFTTKAGESYPWDKCVSDQMKRYGSKDKAEKVCGMIRAKYGRGKEEDGGILLPADKTLEEILTDIEREMETPPEQKQSDGYEASELEFTTHKQADGHYRWVIVSSSSFLDRDKEIVSQKALEEDTAAMNETRQFGSLDWWHTPIQLGACDFSAMHGLARVESGTFHDDHIGEVLSTKANSLAASLSFRHSVTEPDAHGIYNRIRTTGRALLPRGKESNLLTRVVVASKEQTMEMLETKKNELVTLLGGDQAAKDKVDALLAANAEQQKAAEEAGIAHKEEKAKEATPKADEKAWFLADMKPEEFGAMLATGFQKAIEPIMQKLDAMKEAQGAATKETTKAVADEIAKVMQAQSKLSDRLAMLEGLTPKGFRASTASETVTTEDKAKAAQPQADAPYISQFVNKILGAPEQPKP